MRSHLILSSLSLLALAACASTRTASPGDEWIPLFNGQDLSGWKIPEGDNGHWKVVDGVIDYDALSEAPGDKDLWTERSFEDFVLRFDWRAKEYAGLYPIPNVLPDGSHETDAAGKVILTERPNFDSGIYLRGSSKSQVNLWGWPVGSGEVYGYRTDPQMPPEVRTGVTPKVRADKPVGEWNQMEVTMRDDRLTVVLNGQTVIENAQLPGVPEEGPIAIQHHGGRKEDGTMDGASSLVQLRNIYIKELP